MARSVGRSHITFLLGVASQPNSVVRAVIYNENSNKTITIKSNFTNLTALKLFEQKGMNTLQNNVYIVLTSSY